MLAARYHRPGPPDVLRLEEVPVPRPRSGQVLVRVGATSVNGGEVRFRAGDLRIATAGRSAGGIGVGVDVVGVVEALGAGVTELSPGQRVWGMLPASAVLGRAGTAAEFVVMDASRLGPVPERLDDAEAVALLVGGTTAVTALFVHGRLRAGQRVLIRGAAGGVGYAAVQLAHAAGAQVTALARSSATDAVQRLGADSVVDYRQTRLADLGSFDVVLDTAGGPQLADVRHLVASGGRMITMAPNTWPALAAVATRRMIFFSNNPRRADLAVLSAYVGRDAVRPLVATSWPLARIADAHRALENGGGVGKHVVTVS